MAESQKIVRVFLASPGDLQDERRAAKSVVDKVNSIWATSFGYRVELVGWEDTVSGYGRPQAMINRDLERCEFVIGMIWKRWGTSPDVSGPYTSGFEEEFRTSVSNREKKGSPEISLFFKKVDDDHLRDPGVGLKKVLAFKEEIIAKKEILFETFDSLVEFQEKIERCIAHYLQKLHSEETRKLEEESQARSSADSVPQSQVDASSTSESPFSLEGAKFLRDLITRTDRAAEQERIEPVDVARFRLLASAIRNNGNDEQVLGVHDANILFAHRPDFAFSSLERIALIDCGLEHFSSENAPLWCWLKESDAFDRSWLQLCSLVGTTTERVGALSAMRLVSEALSSEVTWNKDDCMKSWFEDSAPSTLKNAALSYLADCGTTADLPTIKAELDRRDYQTTGPAVDAILHISLRDSRENAILSLYELQPESIDSSLLSAIFEVGASVSTKVLSKGIGHRSSDVRRIIAKLLRERGAMTLETANQLISDSDAGVQFEALKSLEAGGRQFSSDEAKKILVKPKANPFTSLFNRSSAKDSEGEAYWNQFRKHQLVAMTDQELEQAANEELFYGGEPHFVLIDRRFTKFGDKLRAAVDNHFKAEFAKELKKMVQEYGGESKLVEHIKPLEEILRREAMRKGLDIICRKGDPKDLSRVRKALMSRFVNYSDADIGYLRKFGEWKDIPLITAAFDNSESGRTGLLSNVFHDGRFQTAARAIYWLGRTRFEELLSQPVPFLFLPYLIAESSDRVFRTLSNRSITQLFRSKRDDVRKVATLKCIEALPKGRLVQLLRDYVSGDEFRYYNVIHWLDFGVSVPRDRVKSAARKVLVREWRS